MTQVSPGFIQLLAATESAVLSMRTERCTELSPGWLSEVISEPLLPTTASGQGVRVQGHNSYLPSDSFLGNWIKQRETERKDRKGDRLCSMKGKGWAAFHN